MLSGLGVNLLCCLFTHSYVVRALQKAHVGHAARLPPERLAVFAGCTMSLCEVNAGEQCNRLSVERQCLDALHVSPFVRSSCVSNTLCIIRCHAARALDRERRGSGPT